LQFQGTQQGEKFVGAVKLYDARIAFDVADLGGSSFEVSMQLKSIDSRSSERDAAMQTADWFDTAHYPVATFKTIGFRQTNAGIVADADLTLRGKTKRIVFPFQFSKTSAGATLDARVTLNRLDFGLGAGEWGEDSMVGHRVDVIVHLQLNQPTALPPAQKPKSTKR
jgi:polyisoprenoid-binding protein YceI